MTRTMTLAGLVCLVFGSPACNSTDLRGNSARLHPTLSKQFVQDDYPQTSSVFTQGHRGDPGVADFEQGEWGSLDVLVVIDDSRSMLEERANLASKLGPLLSKVEKSDWRISVVTTDPNAGGLFASSCQRALIDKADPDATAKFQDAVNASPSPNGIERPFLQAVNGLKCRGGSWLRPGSTLAVLIVSDEDNCSIDESKGYGCAGQPDLEGSYLTNYISSIRALGTDAKIYGIYKLPGDAACTTALVEGKKIHETVTTPATSGSICEADYTSTLTAISEDVAQILKYEFELEQAPDDGTLQIKVDGAEWTKFTLEGKLVKFTEPPPFGAKVEVSYRHGKSGELDAAFKLDKAPVVGSFQVKIDGKALDAGEYLWNEATQQLEFKEPPAERAAIEIVYREKAPLKDTFKIGTGFEPQSLIVLVDSEATKIVRWDEQEGTVTVAPPPPAKSRVEVLFKDKP